MSYAHCSRCARAYDTQREVGCPSCGARPGAKADPTDEIVVAAEHLRRALDRATPDQIAVARERLGVAGASPEVPMLAAPAPAVSRSQTALLVTYAMVLLGRVRAAVSRRALSW